LLSNIYLDPLDQLMKASGIEMVRYADDFVMLCRSEAAAQNALAVVQQWTVQAGLTLHPDKTRIVDTAQAGGFDFLGYHFELGQRRPRQKSLRKFKDTIRAKTKRTNGQSLQAIIANVNRSAQGWFGYFKHSHRYTFEPLDRLLRTRLRSILRYRSGRRGRAWGPDHSRWPNRFFIEQGLFCFVAAHVRLRQPLTG
jgi:RNA-directed DNA polymerase